MRYFCYICKKNYIRTLLYLVKFDIMENGQKIVFRENMCYCNNYILNGKIVHQTQLMYVISCEDYPFMLNKEVIVKKSKNDMTWLICQI